MANENKGKPTELSEETLDQAAGGLLPAVKGATDQQKVMPTDQKTASHTGGVNVALADGSVRFIKESIPQQ